MSSDELALAVAKAYRAWQKAMGELSEAKRGLVRLPSGTDLNAIIDPLVEKAESLRGELFKATRELDRSFPP
jgi:hypothetical protein